MREMESVSDELPVLFYLQNKEVVGPLSDLKRM